MNCIKAAADKILSQTGLYEALREIGEVHPVGSYLINAMAWNDIDLDIENSGMSDEKLYCLTRFITDRFKPLWYEAKREVTKEGKTVWFHGFEAILYGEKWNFDLWFFDRETIDAAEKFCLRLKDIFASDVNKRNASLSIKRGLMEMGLYSFDKYTSMDVYNAVTEHNILTADEFLAFAPSNK